jgi:DNA-binding CsgD family transcriptional regulator
MFGLFRVLHLRKKAVEAINVLRDSQEQLKETEVRYAILRDQVQGLANQRSPSIKKSSIVEILELHSANEVAEWEQLRDWMDRFGLTRTEAEVLARIAVGWSNPDLVEELNLAKSYIHNVRGQLRKKLRIPKNLTLEEAAQRLIKD